MYPRRAANRSSPQKLSEGSFYQTRPLRDLTLRYVVVRSITQAAPLGRRNLRQSHRQLVPDAFAVKFIEAQNGCDLEAVPTDHFICRFDNRPDG
jgi:hypothetical protein